MGLKARYLADKSALARFPHPEFAKRLRPLLEEGQIATCEIVDLEILYSCRGLRDYEEVLEERRSLDSAPITPDVMAAAVELQHALARWGQHGIAIPDLVVAAVAAGSGLVVLHSDGDLGRVAPAGGARQEWQEWVVRPGNIRSPGSSRHRTWVSASGPGSGPRIGPGELSLGLSRTWG